MLENADQKKLSIRTLFTRCLLFALDNEDMIETYLLLIRLQLNSWSVSIAQIVQESLQGTKGRQVHLYRVDKYIFLKKLLLILLRNTFTKGDRVKSFLPVHWIKSKVQLVIKLCIKKCKTLFIIIPKTYCLWTLVIGLHLSWSFHKRFL